MRFDLRRLDELFEELLGQSEYAQDERLAEIAASESPELADELRVSLRNDQPHDSRLFDEILERFETATPAAIALNPGTLLCAGEFEVRGRVGGGGMGEVYRVYEFRCRREVAMKLLGFSYIGHAEAEKRFEAEATLAAKLQHPNTVPVHHRGKLDGKFSGRPYYTMALIGGRTLHEWLAPPTPDEPVTGDFDRRPDLLDVFGAVCSAVAFAHSNKIIHRDLKPRNVMVGAFGETQVLDWGIAKDLRTPSIGFELTPPDDPLGLLNRTSPRRHETRAGQVLGTRGYMPPEQERGEAVDERADVFALGVILTEILTAIWYPEDTPAQSQDGVSRLDRLTRFLDPRDEPKRSLVEFARRCIADRAEDRPPTARELLDRLTTYRDDEQKRADFERVRVATISKDKEILETAAKASRRKRLLAWSLATSAFVISIGLAVGWWLTADLAEQRDAERKRAEGAAEEAQREASDAACAVGDRLCEAGDVGRGLHYFAWALERRPAGDHAHRDYLRAHLRHWQRHLSPLVGLESFPHGVSDVAFHADGRLFAVVCQSGAVHVRAVEGTKPEADFFRPPGVAGAVAFGADPNVLAVGEKSGAISIWRLKDGRASCEKEYHLPNEREWRDELAHVSKLVFSPDCKQLYLADPKGKIWAVDTGPDGKISCMGNVYDDPPDRAAVGAFGLTREGRMLYACTLTGEMRFWWVPTKSLIGWDPESKSITTANVPGAKPYPTRDENWKDRGIRSAARMYHDRGMLIETAYSGAQSQVIHFDLERNVFDNLDYKLGRGKSLAIGSTPNNEAVCLEWGSDHRVFASTNNFDPQCYVRLPTAPHSVTAHPTRSRFITYEPGGTLRVWNLLPDRPMVQRLDRAWITASMHKELLDLGSSVLPPPPQEANRQAVPVTFTAEPERIVWVYNTELKEGGWQGAVQVRSGRTGTPLSPLLVTGGKLLPELGGGRVTSAAISGNSATLVVGYENGMILAWHLQDQVPAVAPHRLHDVQKLSGPGAGVRSVAVSANGDLVAAGTADGIVRIWNAPQGNEPTHRYAHKEVQVVHCDTKGRYVASWGGEHIATNGYVTRIYSSTGTHIVSEDGAAGLGDHVVAFHPTEPKAAIATPAGRLRLVDLTKGICIGEFVPDNADDFRIERVVYSPDGSFLVTWNADKRLRCWHEGTGKQLGPVLKHSVRPNKLEVRANGTISTLLSLQDGWAWEDWPLPQNRGHFLERDTGEKMNPNRSFRFLDPQEWKPLPR